LRYESGSEPPLAPQRSHGAPAASGHPFVSWNLVVSVELMVVPHLVPRTAQMV